MRTIKRKSIPETIKYLGKTFTRHTKFSIDLIYKSPTILQHENPGVHFVIVEVLPGRLKGVLDNHNKLYEPTKHVFIVKKLLIDDNNHAGYHEAMEALKSPGKIIEMTKETYARIYLDIKAKFYNQSGYVSGIPLHHNKTDETIFFCATKINDLKYYAQYGTVEQYKSGQLFKDLPE